MGCVSIAEKSLAPCQLLCADLAVVAALCSVTVYLQSHIFMYIKRAMIFQYLNGSMDYADVWASVTFSEHPFSRKCFGKVLPHFLRGWVEVLM